MLNVVFVRTFLCRSWFYNGGAFNSGRIFIGCGGSKFSVAVSFCVIVAFNSL